LAFSASPNIAGHTVGRKLTILGRQHQSFDLGLSNQQPIEWISMMLRQRSGPIGMTRRDVQGIEAGAGQNLEDIVSEGQAFRMHA
jgi:hypothetical protein